MSSWALEDHRYSPGSQNRWERTWDRIVTSSQSKDRVLWRIRSYRPPSLAWTIRISVRQRTTWRSVEQTHSRVGGRGGFRARGTARGLNNAGWINKRMKEDVHLDRQFHQSLRSRGIWAGPLIFGICRKHLNQVIFGNVTIFLEFTK